MIREIWFEKKKKKQSSSTSPGEVIVKSASEEDEDMINPVNAFGNHNERLWKTRFIWSNGPKTIKIKRFPSLTTSSTPPIKANWGLEKKYCTDYTFACLSWTQTSTYLKKKKRLCVSCPMTLLHRPDRVRMLQKASQFSWHMNEIISDWP